MRKFLIGDIHGGLKALIQLLDKVQMSNDDMLIFLGDYVDGWSESAQVIDYLIELNKKYKCIFIIGNHDIYCRDWLGNKEILNNWYNQGGKATIESYKTFTKKQKEKHLEFFNKMDNYYIDEDNNLFIHAGYSSMHGPSKEHYTSNFSWDRTLWETAVSMDKHLKKNSELFPKRLLLFKEIFIGHTPTIDYKVDTPMNKANVWNVDTGAGFTGKLSILNIDTKDFWQSDKLMELYPNEKGRN